MIPPVVAVLLWKTFYDASSTGVFNTILGWVGLGRTLAPVAADRDAVLVLESTWANAGATVIIYLAALTGVNRRALRGSVGRRRLVWRKIWHITLPQLRGVLLVTMILQIIGTAQVFLEPFLVTSGGPANATLTVLLLIYDYAFGNSLGGDYGTATALSLMLAASSRCSPGLPVPLDLERAMTAARAAAGASRRGAGALITPDDWRRPGQWASRPHALLLLG